MLKCLCLNTEKCQRHLRCIQTENFAKAKPKGFFWLAHPLASVRGLNHYRLAQGFLKLILLSTDPKGFPNRQPITGLYFIEFLLFEEQQSKTITDRHILWVNLQQNPQSECTFRHQGSILQLKFIPYTLIMAVFIISIVCHKRDVAGKKAMGFTFS